MNPFAERELLLCIETRPSLSLLFGVTKGPFVARSEFVREKWARSGGTTGHVKSSEEILAFGFGECVPMKTLPEMGLQLLEKPNMRGPW